MPWLTDVASVARRHGWYKAALGVALLLGFCVPYFALQRLAFMPVRTLPVAWLDDVIQFDPRWVWVYQSGYLLIAGVPLMFNRREDLARYSKAFMWTACTGFLCFAVYPISGPRPVVAPAIGMYAWLVSYDQPTNAFPSLHAGLLACTLCSGACATAGRLSSRTRAWLLGAGVVWAVTVSYAAVATKQHYAVDLPAGAAVGWLACRWTRS